jgi:hypothetical protein
MFLKRIREVYDDLRVWKLPWYSTIGVVILDAH